MKKLPLLLIYSRLTLGFILIVLSLLHINHYPLIAIVLVAVGLLTDIFDGIIARRLNISTQHLRRLDSGIDQVFFISVAVATYIQCPEFFSTHTIKLVVLFSTEGLTYLVSFIKFKKEIATHSIGAKIWTMLLCATLIQIMVQCQSGILFEVFFWFGLISRIEIIAIILALKTWTNDVPTLYHALQLRKGKVIKRHKLFNG